jgi:hypothetical protein
MIDLLSISALQVGNYTVTGLISSAACIPGMKLVNKTQVRLVVSYFSREKIGNN